MVTDETKDLTTFSPSIKCLQFFISGLFVFFRKHSMLRTAQMHEKYMLVFFVEVCWAFDCVQVPLNIIDGP